MRDLRLSTTALKLREDDMAKRIAIRFYQNPIEAFKHRDSSMEILKTIYERVVGSRVMPNSIAEWVAVALFTDSLNDYHSLRSQARQDLQAALLQAERWLQLVDEARTKMAQ